MKNATKGKVFENKKGKIKDKYRIVGPAYDFLSNLYSGRSIHHCKVAMINTDKIRKGDRILFAGVGHGLDAVRAAEIGANVTVVDLSETMLETIPAKPEAEQREIEDPPGPFGHHGIQRVSKIRHGGGKFLSQRL